MKKVKTKVEVSASVTIESEKSLTAVETGMLNSLLRAAIEDTALDFDIYLARVRWKRKHVNVTVT